MMDDETILSRGGTEYDIEQYAKQNGADMTPSPLQTKLAELTAKATPGPYHTTGGIIFGGILKINQP